ncbi:thioesterase family protein [Janibacter sp. G1551]|uniref:thioesterase family protein n=1 Tax=Janibacter sp. G1551 TaxID=3420440 RepID=UPI003D078554
MTAAGETTGTGTVSDFDVETAVTPRAGQPGVFDAELSERWRIGNGVNGGVLLALAARAMRDAFLAGDPATTHADPLAISAYYLTPAEPGALAAHVEPIRTGRSVSTATVSLRQPGEGSDVERLRAIATFGDLGAVHGEVTTTATPPELPPVEECLSMDQAPPQFLRAASLLERLDLRLDPATAGWAAGRPSGKGEMRGWLRLADGREPDVLMLLLAIDALPPTAFELGLPGWTPTLELSAHVRSRPAAGWLRIVITTRTNSGGFVEEDAEVWDSEGRLVALSRQLARVTPPRR